MQHMLALETIKLLFPELLNHLNQFIIIPAAPVNFLFPFRRDSFNYLLLAVSDIIVIRS